MGGEGRTACRGVWHPALPKALGRKKRKGRTTPCREKTRFRRHRLKCACQILPPSVSHTHTHTHTHTVTHTHTHSVTHTSLPQAHPSVTHTHTHTHCLSVVGGIDVR